MTANAIGPDQHQGADRVADRDLQLIEAERNGGRHAVDGGSVRLGLGLGEHAVLGMPVGQLGSPTRAAQLTEQRPLVIPQLGKERIPAGIDRTAVMQKTCVQISDIAAIDAGQ